ncbi:NUDIX domain-containing protein [Nonomuraea salmonea]|uniref:NUDIX domain-containing protein n=1 Tax=Nonomuraea salmonea TaxID=46181 RepID=A0ABV5NM38_9ACTN
MTTDDLIRAAGAVILRGSSEVALVHRPRYADWTFPKGKLHPGEHVVAAALREVREETGLTVVLGRPLPPVHYRSSGRLKRVDYWVGRVADDAGLIPDDEVDELRWVPVEEAEGLLSYTWDVALLRSLGDAPLDTVPLVLVRHGSAGSRDEWDGDDEARPLDERGAAQAAVLAAVLPAYRPGRLVSSPSARCVQTLEPYARVAGAAIEVDPLLSEEDQDPRWTPELVAALPPHAVVCSHGKVLPGLVQALAGQDVRLPKGGLAVLHRAGERVVAVEQHAT